MTVPVLSKLAYSVDEFAELVSLSKSSIQKAIARGELVPAYSGTKPLITRAEGERWLGSLPAERAS